MEGVVCILGFLCEADRKFLFRDVSSILDAAGGVFGVMDVGKPSGLEVVVNVGCYRRFYYKSGRVRGEGWYVNGILKKSSLDQ